MDGNLYQLMKARDHKQFDGSSVKSILFQIMSGLEHIHDNSFFHRDIKPENILVSTSAPDSGNAFKRYSSIVTPPSTPPAYTIKIADFGLARETHSRVPYTTYVSTRWYRAPEVLLRAGEYSAPVDIWAIGAMAVEIATLKPLFPGGNEVDQVWRVCEIMGSPGDWVNKHGERVGGGEWRDGVRLAQKLGFSFPKGSVPRNDAEEKVVQKIGRQLSVASRGNHYADAHRQEAERALNGQGGLASPTSNQKESFFSHLRKRARRISGRHQAPPSPNSADVEASAGRLPWSNRQSMAIDAVTIANQASNPSMDSNFAELDKALQSVRYSLDASTQLNDGVNEPKRAYRVPSNPMLKRHHSLPYGPDGRSDSQTPSSPANAPVSSRTRRAVRQAPNPSHRYDTPDEEEELLDEAIASAHSAVQRLDRKAQENAATKLNNHTSAESTRPQVLQVTSDPGLCLPYLTPSPSANRTSVTFGQLDFTPSKPVDIVKTRTQLDSSSLWPTPPYEENEWAAAAAASIFAAQAAYR
ncbi:hypothetical protein B0A49_02995 [Cryomyces minteri]|uniref:Protein kinase domain-containing protein n=1 Tax=Cryomyces minteri TaxID=331657 RepID=A0A4U0XUW4_9PEZI|nr:hypothetical protein B0A49_08675 [Cryomyces minteri]TKA79568.1 hypothetical protein B0A49_02995 [Cryomyces minteri]